MGEEGIPYLDALEEQVEAEEEGARNYEGSFASPPVVVALWVAFSAGA